MLVMFGRSPTMGPCLFLGVLAPDVAKLQGGLTLEYINPPHDPQLVKNIVVCYGATKAALVAQLRAAGVEVTEHDIPAQRTDRGFRGH